MTAALVFTLAAGAAKPGGGTPSGPFPVPNGPLSVAAGFEGNDADTPPRSTVPSTPAPGAPTNGGGYTINFDWNSLKTNQTYTGTAPYLKASGATSGWQWLALTDDQKSNTDTGFAGGVKQDDSCATVSGGSAPNKDDLKRAYLAAKTVNGHTYLELGWVRIPQNTTSASAHIAFEFNQGGTACPAGSDGLVARQAGDMLLLYDFEGGSNDPPHVTLSRWVTSGACGVSSHSPPCWGSFIDLELTNPIAAEANVDTGLSHICNKSLSPTGCGPNETDINTSTPSEGTTYVLPSSTSDSLAPTTETVGASEFGEATVDLTNAGVFGASNCVSFGQVEAVSRSSGDSGTAAMEDLVGPGSFSLSNCTSSVSTQMKSSPDNVDANFTNLSNGASITSGTWVRDTATVSVTGTSVWRGNVAFYLCSSTSALAECDPDNSAENPVLIDAAVAVGQGGVNPPTNGNVATSSKRQITAAGNYCWAAVFTSTSPTGLPNAHSFTGECFSATAPTTIATNPWVYPQDRAVISASSGGTVAGTVVFRLFDTLANCNAGASANTVGSNGLLYIETRTGVTGSGTPSTATVDTANGTLSSGNYRITSSTSGSLYWRVTFTSTNNSQTGSSSPTSGACVENTAVTITADGTVSFS